MHIPQQSVPSPVQPRGTRAFQVPLLYYGFYAVCAVINTQLIPSATVSWPAIGLSILFATLFVGSAWISNATPRTSEIRTSPAEEKIVDRMLMFVPWIAAILIFLRWAFLIQRYGSLPRIFAHAFAVRMNTIGHDGSTSEVMSGYLISLLFAAIPLALARWLRNPGMRSLMVVFSCVTLVFASDLAAFARMGSLWNILTLASVAMLFRVEVKISLKRLAVVALVLVLVASLPRVFRHGGLAVFSSGHGDLDPTVSLNAAVAGTKEAFEDYASGLAAFSAFLGYREEPTRGMRTFTPLWRIANRLGVTDSGNYITTIDRPADNIFPIYYNLYTVLRDLYQDFGLMGVTLGGISLGFVYGRLFTVGGVIGRAITIMMTTWLLYTPFYNAFSFGTFLIPFCLLLLLAFWCRMVNRSRPSEAIGHA